MLKASNAIMGVLVGTFGLTINGAQMLTVRGRTTGAPHSVPVNPFEVDGATYLLSPRGNTQWVKNLRVAGEGTLGKGKSRSHFTVAVEVADEQKPLLIETYLKRWHRQVGGIMHVEREPTDERLMEIAPSHPVFRIVRDGAPSD